MDSLPTDCLELRFSGASDALARGSHALFGGAQIQWLHAGVGIPLSPPHAILTLGLRAEAFRLRVEPPGRVEQRLGLGKIPPTVERHIKAEVGAAVLWVEDVRNWEVKHPVSGPDERAWVREWVRLKMFDKLSGNIDRNQGNILYDSEYHLILIDHSRAFRDVVDLNQYKGYAFVDAPLWERMEALTMETMQPTLGNWVSKGMLYAVLDRRNRMKREIDKLLAARGPSIWLR